MNARRAESGEAALKYFVPGALLLGGVPVRDPRLRGHRIDQSPADRRLSGPERLVAQRCSWPGWRCCSWASGSRWRPCPSICGRPTSTRARPARPRASWRRWRRRVGAGPVAGVRLVVRVVADRLAARRCGCWRRSRCCLGRWSPWPSATSSGCSPTRRSTTLASSCSGSRWRRQRRGRLALLPLHLHLHGHRELRRDHGHGGTGDKAHDLDHYRGLAARRPWLAGSLGLLLVQAGIPFTTGFLAKLEVISASVGGRSTALAGIAMVSAAIAAFFYLRVILPHVHAGAGHRHGSSRTRHRRSRSAPAPGRPAPKRSAP